MRRPIKKAPFAKMPMESRTDDFVSPTQCTHARGVGSHAAVFGSVVRGENRSDRDLDILVEFKPWAGGTIYDYVRFKEYVASLFQGLVDVIDHAALKPHIRAPTQHVMPSMLSERESGALRDMLFYVNAAERFAHGQTFESLRDDPMRLYAIIRGLEIISEASRRYQRSAEGAREVDAQSEPAASETNFKVTPITRASGDSQTSGM